MSRARLPDSAIVPGAIVTNDKGRFRLVTEIRRAGNWRDVHYTAAYRNTKGKMKLATPFKGSGDSCGIYSLIEWAVREATAEERAAVLAVIS